MEENRINYPEEDIEIDDLEDENIEPEEDADEIFEDDGEEYVE